MLRMHSSGLLTRCYHMQGVRLYVSQLWALSAKRTQTGLRDARSALFQIVVPIALVLLSLWVRKATFSAATEPDLAINRYAKRHARQLAASISVAVIW